MNTITATPPVIVHPQPSWLPKPLFIHPSIPDDLVREMLRVADLFHAEPERYHGGMPYIVHGKCGCICAQVTKNEQRNFKGTDTIMYQRWPKQHEALFSIFHEAAHHLFDTPWAIARITQFLETAT